MSKIPAKRINSDDCAIYVGRKMVGSKVADFGVPYYVHKGEWIEIIPVGSVGEFLAYSELLSGSFDIPEVPELSETATDEEKAKAIAALEAAQSIVKVASSTAHNMYENMVQSVASRIINWNWTDLDGKPLPNPYNKPDVLKMLSADELVYLFRIGQGETPAERKNA